MVAHFEGLKHKANSLFTQCAIAFCYGNWMPTRDVPLDTLFGSEIRTPYHNDEQSRESVYPTIVFSSDEAIATYQYNFSYLPKTGLINRIVILQGVGFSSYKRIFPVTVNYSTNRLTEVDGYLNIFSPGHKYYDPVTNIILTCIDQLGTMSTPIPPGLTAVSSIGNGVILATFAITDIICGDSLPKMDFTITAKETIS